MSKTSHKGSALYMPEERTSDNVNIGRAPLERHNTRPLSARKVRRTDIRVKVLVWF